MTNLKISTGGIGLALAALVLLTLAFSPAFAKASDFDFGGWVDTGFYDSYAPSYDSYDNYGWVDTGYYDTYDASYDSYDDYGWVDTGYYDTYDASYDSYDDYGWVDTGYYDTYEPSYDYADSGYSQGGYSQGGYSQGGYSQGGYSYPSYNYPSYRPTPTPSQPDYNHCVNNSCNTNTNINTRIDIRDAQPYIAYQPYPIYNQTDVCYNLPGIQVTAPVGYYTHAGNCVVAQYQNNPYISLSSVPYTGLEMGPLGTALYWGFLVLWCLVAAYLIAVKKVQNKVVGGISAFLFPATATASHSHAHTTPAKASVVTASKGDEIDSFIQGQINRSR